MSFPVVPLAKALAQPIPNSIYICGTPELAYKMHPNIYNDRRAFIYRNSTWSTGHPTFYLTTFTDFTPYIVTDNTNTISTKE